MKTAKLQLPSLTEYPELFGEYPRFRPTAKDAAPYYKLLKRLPKEVILEVAGGDLNLNRHQSCVCGLAYRAALANALKKDMNDPSVKHIDGYVPARCSDQFGGEMDAWSDLYYGVTDERMPAIERAFEKRLQECLYPSRKRS